MKYTQFLNQVEAVASGHKIVFSTLCYGSLVQETVDGNVLIDRAVTQFSTVEEAQDYINQQRILRELEEEIQQEQYAEISDNKIVDIIKQHHSNIRVTDTLVESYVELASSKSFTTDPVVANIRCLNKRDRLIENYVDFKLDDGTQVVISEGTQDKINKLFAEHIDVVEYMRASKDNFLDVLNQLEE